MGPEQKNYLIASKTLLDDKTLVDDSNSELKAWIDFMFASDQIRKPNRLHPKYNPADPELQFLLPGEGEPPDFPSDVGAINYPVMIPQASVSNLAGIIKAVKGGYGGGYKAFGPGTMHGSD